MFRTKKEVLNDILGFASSSTRVHLDFVRISRPDSYTKLALNVGINANAASVLPLYSALHTLFVRSLPSACNACASHRMLESTNG
jgi:hypothetical protein